MPRTFNWHHIVAVSIKLLHVSAVIARLSTDPHVIVWAQHVDHHIDAANTHQDLAMIAIEVPIPMSTVAILWGDIRRKIPQPRRLQ